MKSAQMIRIAAMVTVTIATIQVADARPFAIDEHGAICQGQDPTSIMYELGGITSLRNNTVVICPLGAIALLNDTLPQVKIQIKMYTTGSMTCKFTSTSDGSGNQSVPFTPSSGTYSTAQVAPVDEPVSPHDGTMPVEVSVLCTLANNSSIGSIQIESQALP